MSAISSFDLFMRAARGEPTPRPPIWLMRQAGRTDPEYLRVKAESGLSLGELFRHPELAAQISLLPRRIGVDAIIYFQDILTPLAPMGAPFRFAPGPVFDQPLRDPEQAARLHPYDVGDELPFIPEIFRLIRGEIGRSLPVLGFAGAPLTLAVFLIEGASFGDSADTAMRFIAEHPGVTHALLDRLTAVTIDYLRLQIASGAAAVQLFESAAHILDARLYREFALPYQQQVFEALRGEAPTILFARECTDLDLLAQSSADILSLPCTVSIAKARERLGADRVVQGNLDNVLLADGSLDEIRRTALDCVESGGRRGHIFNLSHGLLARTPHEHVVELVRLVRGCGVEG